MYMPTRPVMEVRVTSVQFSDGPGLQRLLMLQTWILASMQPSSQEMASHANPCYPSVPLYLNLAISLNNYVHVVIRWIPVEQQISRSIVSLVLQSLLH